jgi:hypothetical protein
VPVGGVHPARGRRGDRPLGAGEEVVDADGLAVAVQFGPGAEQPGAAVPPWVNAVMVKVAVIAPGNSSATTWWSTASLSQA